MILMPHFSFYQDGLIGTDEEGAQVWNSDALKMARALVGQIVAIDKMLRGASDTTPPPSWLAEVERPQVLKDVESAIQTIDNEIGALREQRQTEDRRKTEIEEYSRLLYETGKPLERAVEKVLRLLGYSVCTFRSGDIEIDHLIVGPSGKRMIGETEGKDTSAVDISKYRQLESNIGEDFEREDVDTPAKGLLFGNGFRLSRPEERGGQFTQKSLTNAGRLGSALIQTADLYPVARYLLDNPDDEGFKADCRAVIEGTEGGIVSFPLK